MRLSKYKFPTEEEIKNLSRFVLRKKNKNVRELKKAARNWITAAWENKLDYEVNWLGIPIIQNPYDMVRMQELIFKVKPDVIIETGIAHGGSLIYYASLLELLGKGGVVGIDNDIRAHNKRLLVKHPMYKRITLIEGSSTDGKIVRRVRGLVKKRDTTLVILDSNHTHSHVLKELKLYAPLVSRGSYIVVFDTLIENLPKHDFKDRPWGRGSNPHTAVRSFLKKNKDFIVDKDVENRIVLTTAPGGYLNKIR